MIGDLKLQIIETIVYAVFIAVSTVVVKSIVITILIALFGTVTLLYLKGNKIVVKSINKWV